MLLALRVEWSGGIVLVASLLALALLSCALPPNHETFVSHRNHEVGLKMEDVRSSTSIKSYADSRFLSNGNVEYGFKYRRTCRVYYEVNPETRIIVGWRWEGLRQHCVIGG